MEKIHRQIGKNTETGMDQRRVYILHGMESCPWCQRASGLLQSHRCTVRWNHTKPGSDWMLANKYSTVPQIFRVRSSGSLQYIGGYEELVAHLARPPG